MVWLRKFPLENILLDAALLVAAFLLPNANRFLLEHLTAAFWVTAPFQVAALFCAFYGRNSDGGGRKLPDWLSSIYVLNLILAVGSFLWLFFIAFAVEKQTGQFPNWAFIFGFFTALFGGVLGFGLASEISEEDDMSLVKRFLVVLVVFGYLYFTESIIEVAIGVSDPGIFTIVLVTFISYLPVRLALAFQPPFSYWDLASAIFCFGIYLAYLLGPN